MSAIGRIDRSLHHATTRGHASGYSWGHASGAAGSSTLFAASSSFSAFASSAMQSPPAASACTAGPSIPQSLASFVGHSAGSGQCVALVRVARPDIGLTSTWVRGASVEGNTQLQPGTVIATFNASGRYANAANGSSHAAIYLGQSDEGLRVLDQWAGKVAAVRTIPWSSPGAAAANSGSAFHVVSRQVTA